jgi:hypothetical protein
MAKDADFDDTLMHVSGNLLKDNISKQVTIGTSYTRYWLPIFIMAIPFMAMLLDQFLTWFKKWRWLQTIVSIAFFAPLIYFSTNLTVLAGSENLFKVKENIYKYENLSQSINQLTEEDAVIIVDQMDKAVFPQRQVVVFLMNYEIFRPMPRLVKIHPVYYFTLMPSKDIEYINQRKIKEYNLRFEFVEDFELGSLYKLNSVEIKEELIEEGEESYEEE